MESRVEWIYHTLEDEAHFLDSNNVLVGCRNALWDLLRRSVDAWEMQWVLIALAPSAFYIFKEIRCTHFFPMHNFHYMEKKLTGGQRTD